MRRIVFIKLDFGNKLEEVPDCTYEYYAIVFLAIIVILFLYIIVRALKNFKNEAMGSGGRHEL